MNELLLHEKRYRKQQARLFRLQEGDENTSFFHASTATRRKTNHVSFLELEDGSRVNDQYGMCNIVKDYFLNIFAKPNHISFDNEGSSPRTVTRTQNERLTEEVNMKEFTRAMHQIHPDKSSA